MLASSLIRRPSAVRPGPSHAGCAPRPGPRDPRLGDVGPSGATSTVPVAPSTHQTVPSSSASTRRARTTAGMPSARARIAVWLVGPPSSVTKASTARVEVGRVRRGEVAGDQHERVPGVGDARRGHAEQLADDAVAHVLDVARPRADVAAGAGEQVAERVGGVPHGARRRDASVAYGALGQVGELRVGGHHRRRLEDRLRLARAAARGPTGRWPPGPWPAGSGPRRPRGPPVAGPPAAR